MNTVIKGVIVGVCALAFAQIAMAKGPKASATTDDKNSKKADIVVTLAQGEPHYRCDYAWQINFKNGAQTSDACHVEVPDGLKNSVVCSHTYDTRIEQVILIASTCSPIPS